LTVIPSLDEPVHVALDAGVQAASAAPAAALGQA